MQDVVASDRVAPRSRTGTRPIDYARERGTRSEDLDLALCFDPRTRVYYRL